MVFVEESVSFGVFTATIILGDDGMEDNKFQPVEAEGKKDKKGFFSQLPGIVLFVFIFGGWYLIASYDDSGDTVRQSVANTGTAQQTTYPSSYTTPEPVEKIPVKIESWNWYTDSDYGTKGSVRWTVEVKNISDTYIDNVKVKFATYDANGKIITSEFTYVDGLAPGGTSVRSSFATYFGTEKTAKIWIEPYSWK